MSKRERDVLGYLPGYLQEERYGEVGADDARRQLEQLQKTTDRFVGEVDRVGLVKEQEVLEV